MLQRLDKGYFEGGIPYCRLGQGSKTLVVFEGFNFEHKPPSEFAGKYRFLTEDYTVWIVSRRKGLPKGYAFDDMARDYAAMIRREFGGPVDIIGISTGGGIALHFTADYPELVRRLIIHSSAHTLGDRAKEVQMEIARLIEKGRYNKAWTELMKMVLPHRGSKGVFTWPLIGLVALIMSMSAPKDPQDAVVTLEAEDKYAFFGRLGEVTAPVLVVGGTADAFYPEEILRQTAAGLPKGVLKLYPGQGHVAGGPAFRRDVLQFLGQRVAPLPSAFFDTAALCGISGYSAAAVYHTRLFLSTI